MLKFRTLVLGLLLALICARVEAQVPPPPAVYEGPPVVEGYDTRTLFQRWVLWVEGRKGDVLEAALAEAAAPPEGMRRRGSALMKARAFGDQGLALVADISIFCPNETTFPDTEGCRPQMRDITIPSPAYGYGADARLSNWVSEHYDPAALVQAMKAAQIAPDADPWRANLDPVFASMASPLAVLQATTRIRTADGRNCPGLAAALEAAEGQTLEFQIDLWGVGKDVMPPAPRPHATQWRYELQSMEADRILVEAGPSLAAIVSPVFEAGAACQRDAG